MASSDIQWDVYTTPRLDPIQFGDFVAADGAERERLLQGAKYFYRSHRARAWYARDAIHSYLTATKPNLGNLDAALTEVSELAKTSTLGPEKLADAQASQEALKNFIGLTNKLELAGKSLEALPEQQFPVKIGDIQIQVELECLIRSVDAKHGRDKIGGIFLNTRKWNGLGTKDDTIKKRNKAGETVSILIFKRIMDEFSDEGEPHQPLCLHIYARAQKIWPCPTSYFVKLKNMDAEGRAITLMWQTVKPPSGFNAAKAKMHD